MPPATNDCVGPHHPTPVGRLDGSFSPIAIFAIRQEPMRRQVTYIIPQKLAGLHGAEEQLRQKARSMIAHDPRLQLHLAVTEAAMDLADMLRQFNSSDENLKVAVVLGMRT